MKNDYSFKFVAAIILAGVIVALAAPAPTSHATHRTAGDPAPAAHATE